MDSRLTVQFARGPRPPRHEFSAPPGERPPRPRRTPHRMNIAGLPTDTSWQVCILFLALFSSFRLAFTSLVIYPL